MAYALPVPLQAPMVDSCVPTTEIWCTPVPNLKSGAETVQKQLASALEYSPLVAVLDLSMVHLGAFCALRQLATAPQSQSLYLHLLPMLSVLATLCYAMAGLYRSWSRRRCSELFTSLALSQLLFAMCWMALCGWEPRWSLGHSVMALAAVCQFLLLAALRYSLRACVRILGHLESGILIVETPERAAELRTRIGDASVRWFNVECTMTAAEFLNLPAASNRYGALLIDQQTSSSMPIASKAASLGMSVFLLPGVYELWMVSARPALADDLLMLRLSPPYLRPAHRAFKRLFDVSISFAILALATPLLLLAALLIRLTSPGALFYRQTRIGANGQPFELLKFRTMIKDAERTTGPVLARRHDPRITPLGRLLRATRTDELPQLLNVLAGSMSLIGPRPERPPFVELLRQQLPGYDLRQAVKPGITGLAQVNGSYWTKPELKLRFDLMYIYNYSLWLDLRILARTALIVFDLSRAGELVSEESASRVK